MAPKYRDFTGDERGWITWLWSKAGVMIAFFAALIVIVMVYGFVGKLMDSDHANKISRNLADAISQVSNAGEGYRTVYYLPSEINDHEYTARIVERDDAKGIVISVFGSDENVSGGSSLPQSLSIRTSNKTLHDRSNRNMTLLCMANIGGAVEINAVPDKTACLGV